MTRLEWQDSSKTTQSLTLDACVKEEVQFDLEVTDHPVERGVNVTDHARPKPKEFTIEGVMTDTPPAGARPFYHQGVFNDLLDVQENAFLLTVYCDLGTWNNLVLYSLKAPRDKETGESLRFEGKLKQVRFVTNATTVVATKQPKSKPPVKQGAKPTAPTTTNWNPKFGPTLNKALYGPQKTFPVAVK